MRYRLLHTRIMFQTCTLVSHSQCACVCVCVCLSVCLYVNCICVRAQMNFVFQLSFAIFIAIIILYIAFATVKQRSQVLFRIVRIHGNKLHIPYGTKFWRGKYWRIWRIFINSSTFSLSKFYTDNLLSFACQTTFSCRALFASYSIRVRAHAIYMQWYSYADYCTFQTAKLRRI